MKLQNASDEVMCLNIDAWKQFLKMLFLKQLLQKTEFEYQNHLHYYLFILNTIRSKDNNSLLIISSEGKKKISNFFSFLNLYVLNEWNSDLRMLYLYLSIVPDTSPPRSKNWRMKQVISWTSLFFSWTIPYVSLFWRRDSPRIKMRNRCLGIKYKCPCRETLLFFVVVISSAPVELFRSPVEFFWFPRNVYKGRGLSVIIQFEDILHRTKMIAKVSKCLVF